eukprot:gene5910-7359_t
MIKVNGDPITTTPTPGVGTTTTSSSSSSNNNKLGFEIVKAKEEFRDYVDGDHIETVSKTYKLSHTNQTYEYALSKRRQYEKLETGIEMTIWEAAEFLNTIIDESDPDSHIPQINHLLQTAEAIRKVYPGEEYDWFHLAGFVHDLGKILLSPRFKEPQWAVVGDTFPVGCKFDESNIFYQHFKDNPDEQNSKYNTELGVYERNCGLEQVIMSWGHDEYFYHVCVGNKSTLPEEALYIIRYHSFYPWHQQNRYKHLTNEKDESLLKWVKEFNLFDLYSKDPTPIDVDAIKPYYQSLIKKYFPDVLKW